MCRESGLRIPHRLRSALSRRIGIAKAEVRRLKQSLLGSLICTECGGDLTTVSESDSLDIAAGNLRCIQCGCLYPIVNHVPRFSTPAHYADSFGFEWSRFRRTQLDSFSGTAISHDRFFRCTGWTVAELKDRRVLDAGCGAGRFAEVALKAGAEVFALDSSSAVDATWSNLSSHERLHVVQGDIYNMPFRQGIFDFVYCFGVLQHTPNVELAFSRLVPLLRLGGRLAVDAYPRSLLNLLWPKYWLRPFTKRLASERLLRWIAMLLPILFPLSDLCSRAPFIGRKLRHIVPVANYRLDFPQLTNEQLYEWALLDTFDMFSPRFDKPVSARMLARWFTKANLRDVQIFNPGLLVGRGERQQ